MKFVKCFHCPNHSQLQSNSWECPHCGAFTFRDYSNNELTPNHSTFYFQISGIHYRVHYNFNSVTLEFMARRELDKSFHTLTILSKNSFPDSVPSTDYVLKTLMQIIKLKTFI